MPIVNGAYVAPTWNNDAPPAINAAELQDICDTIETYDTSKANVSYVNTFVRPNLLDNAYFVGGGSQQGNGQFPVNQRGATAYNASGYTIDRWQVGINNAVAVQSDCVKITDQSGNHQNWKIFTQKIANADQYRGKTLTMSILCGDTVTAGLAKPLIRVETNGTYVDQTMGDFLSANTVAKVTWTIPTSGTFDTIVVGVMHDAQKTGSYKIKGMKLELGDAQTLAHQESGVWVLNEVPNFEVELAKCQRYDYLNTNGMSQFIRAAYIAANAIYFDFPVPVPMRAGVVYTVLSSGQIGVFNMAGAAQTGFTFAVQNAYGGSLRITATKTSHGLSDAYLSVSKTLFSSAL